VFLIFDKFRPDFGKMKANLLTTCLFGCILQLSMVSVAGALKCYQCHSMDEYTCGEFFRTDETAVELTECRLSNAKYCIKTTGIYDGNLGSRRFCSERYLDNYCTYVQRPGDQREYRSCVYTCTGDGCNGSNSLNPFSWLLVSSLMIFMSTTFVTFPTVF